MIHDAVVHKITRRNPFLQDWPYYGIIDVLNPVATAQYQHSVTIPTKPGMMHDFRDLRFFQPDGTEIPFWNESKTDGSTSFNWFKPYSPSQRKAYVFYGNREAVSQSNGDKTFEFFDDFLGSALDTTKWTQVSGTTGTNTTVSGGSLNLVPTGADNTQTVKSNSTFGVGYSARCRAQFSADASHFHSSAPFGFWTTQSFGIPFFAFQDNYPSDGTLYVRSYNTSDDQFSCGTGYSGYHIWELKRAQTTNNYAAIDGTVVKTSTQFPTGSLIIILSAGYQSPTAYPTYFDWVAVRKYTATEPVCQLNQSGLRNPAYR